MTTHRQYTEAQREPAEGVKGTAMSEEEKEYGYRTRERNLIYAGGNVLICLIYMFLWETWEFLIYLHLVMAVLSLLIATLPTKVLGLGHRYRKRRE